MKREDSLISGNAIAEVPARVLVGQLNLNASWARVQDKHGMPGADGVAVSRFGRQARTNLAALQSQLAGDRYQPLPLRMAEVEKKSGSMRLLLVPCIADRVIQSAVAQWLGARWNPAFDPNSFAYRPGVGVASALRALSALRERGYHWVLDADIRSFFDSIDQNLLAPIMPPALLRAYRTGHLKATRPFEWKERQLEKPGPTTSKASSPRANALAQLSGSRSQDRT
jgi:retron-type reverse transcriptase